MAEAPLLIVGIGDIKIGQDPSIIRTSLGSCIGVCLYHPATKRGGMLHCMLPSAEENRQKAGFRPAKYADSGLEELVGDLKKTYGIEPRSLTAKFFGGASMLKAISMNIGQNNEHAVRAKLKEYNIPVSGFKTGGEKGYQIDFDLSDGSVMCRVFGQPTERY